MAASGARTAATLRGLRWRRARSSVDERMHGEAASQGRLGGPRRWSSHGCGCRGSGGGGRAAAAAGGREAAAVEVLIDSRGQDAAAADWAGHKVAVGRRSWRLRLRWCWCRCWRSGGSGSDGGSRSGDGNGRLSFWGRRSWLGSLQALCQVEPLGPRMLSFERSATNGRHAFSRGGRIEGGHTYRTLTKCRVSSSRIRLLRRSAVSHGCSSAQAGTRARLAAPARLRLHSGRTLRQTGHSLSNSSVRRMHSEQTVPGRGGAAG